MHEQPALWKRWAVMAVVPTLALVVGVVFLPRPLPLSDEKASVDREALRAAVKTTAPKPTSPTDVLLGDAVRVLGADLPKTTLSPGGALSATFYFGVDAPVDEAWQVFVHIDAKGGAYRIHGDHYPVGGAYATTLWREGEFIADTWSSTVPRDAPAGLYDVWIGLYAGEERLHVTGGATDAADGTHRVRVGTLTVQ